MSSNALSPFATVSGYPEQLNGCMVLKRLLQSLGFRLHWACEGMRAEDWNFAAGNEVMTPEALLNHIDKLLRLTASTLQVETLPSPEAGDQDSKRRSMDSVLVAALARCDQLTDAEVHTLTVRDLPVWHLINGPIADALTHVGQIITLRRLNGNPVHKHSVFRMHA